MGAVCERKGETCSKKVNRVGHRSIAVEVRDCGNDSKWYQ